MMCGTLCRIKLNGKKQRQGRSRKKHMMSTHSRTVKNLAGHGGQCVLCGSIEPDELSFYRRIISDEPSWCVGRACSISAAIPDGKLRGSSQASRGGGRQGQMGSFPSFFRQGGVGGRWERARRETAGREDDEICSFPLARPMYSVRITSDGGGYKWVRTRPSNVSALASRIEMAMGRNPSGPSGSVVPYPYPSTLTSTR